MSGSAHSARHALNSAIAFRIGAAFMKLGRAPTTTRSFIAEIIPSFESFALWIPPGRTCVITPQARVGAGACVARAPPPVNLFRRRQGDLGWMSSLVHSSSLRFYAAIAQLRCALRRLGL